MKILIVRHGEPDYAIDSLTPKGWREAELLSERLRKIPVTDFYVSPLGRAQDTARATLAATGRTAETLPWLEEFRGSVTDPFTGEKRLAWDFAPRYWTDRPELYDRDAWRENDLYRSGDAVQIYDETAAGIDALLARYGYVRRGGLYACEGRTDATIVLFCHCGLGMTILSHLIGVSPVVLWHGFFMPTSSVTTVVSEERIPGEAAFRCAQLGDTSHLYIAGEPISSSGLFAEIEPQKYSETKTEESPST